MKKSLKLNGMNFITFEPNVIWSKRSFIKIIRKYNRLHLMRRIAELNIRLSQSYTSYVELNGVPYTAQILEKLCMLCMKFANDDAKMTIGDDVLSDCLKLIHALIDTEEENRPEDAEIVLFYRFQQLAHSQNFLHYIGRSIYLYLDLWPRVSEAKDINILKEIQEIVKLPFEALLVFSYNILGSNEPYFYKFDSPALSMLSNGLNVPLDEDSHRKFLDWTSRDYLYFTTYNEDISPFTLYPILETKTIPPGENKEVFIPLFSDHLMRKVSVNLYYYLIDKFKTSPGENAFKVAYGYVLQEYVGDLLKFYMDPSKVNPEIEYSDLKNKKKTVDWIIVDSDYLLLIEVKQSSIFLNAKLTASLELIKKDIKNTVKKGLSQLTATEAAIKSGNHTELQRYGNIQMVLKLLVVGDDFFDGNKIVKNVLVDELGSSVNKYHIISILEFERLLEFQSQAQTYSIFEFLSVKENNPEYVNMDFDILMTELYKEKLETYRSSFLHNIHSRFFEKIELNSV